MRSATLTLRGRLLRALLPLILLVLGLGAAGMALLWHLGGGIDAILRENYASVVAMERLNESLDRIDSSFQLALAGHGPGAAAQQYEARWGECRESLGLEQHNVTLPGEAEAAARLTALVAQYRAKGDLFHARPPGDPERERDYFGRGGLLDTFQELKSVSGEILVLNETAMEDESRRAKLTAALSITGLGIGLAAAILLAALLVWNTKRSLVQPIKALTRSAVAISEGDLTRKVSYGAPDELGQLAQAFDHMVEQIRASRHALEQRNAELREAEASCRSIFENSIEGIFQSTPDGRYLAVNHALAEMLGYTSGQELMEFVRHIGSQVYVDPERRIELSRRLVHEGVVRNFEAECRRKDGSTRWLSYNTRAVRDAAGAVLFYEGFVTDVTARKEAERELAESEGELKRAQAVAHLGSWHLDVNRDRLTWSDEAYRIFGVARGTPLTYEAFLAAVHPDDRERVDDAWAAAMRGAPYDIEHRILVPDPEHAGASSVLKWVRERAEVSFDTEGRAVEGIGTVHDVTTQRLAAEQLRQLNRAHRALSSANHALVRATDELSWMREICRLVVEEAGYRLSWVGLAEDDEAKSVRPIASAGFDEGYLEGLHITWADTEWGRGPAGTAIRTGKVIATKDVASDPLLAPWRTEALRRGYASILAVPIILDGKRFGALTIYAAEPDAFAEAEVTLLTELAEDLAYGIATLRMRAEWTRVMEELQRLPGRSPAELHSH